MHQRKNKMEGVMKNGKTLPGLGFKV